MTKKKNGFFSKLKEKFSKKNEDYEDEFEEFDEEIDEESEDDYEEKYHAQDDEESEFEESTGEIEVTPELIAQSSDEDELPSIQEGTNNSISFDSLEKDDDDEIEDLLNDRDDEVASIEADDEEFSATEFKITEEQKEELSELETPVEELIADSEAQEEYYDEEEDEDEDEIEEEFYEDHAPKESVQQRFASFLANMKNKFPKNSKSKIAFDGGTIDDSQPKKKSKLALPALNNFNWPAIVEKTFTPDSRQRIHQMFLATIVLGSSYYGGKLVANSVSSKLTPKTSSKRARVGSTPLANFREQAKFISKSNLFNTIDPHTPVATKKDDGPKVDKDLVCLKSNKKSKLGIKLVNTIVLQDSVKSIAAVQVRGNKEVLSIREGDKISTDAQIGKINRMKLVFKNLKTGECEYVETKDKKSRNMKPIKVISSKRGKALLNKYKDSRIKNVGNNFKIKKKVRDEMLSNISEVLTQARAIQIKNPDGSLSFKMSEIVPGSIYSKLNIQDGDIITGVNGKKFNNLNEIMNLFGKIKEIDQFELSLKRDGVEQNLEYNFE